MGSDDRGKKLSGKFLPKMTQEILHRAAHAAVIIGRAQNISVGSIDSRFQGWKVLRAVGRLRIIERQRLLQEIQYINTHASCAQMRPDMLNHGASDRLLLKATHNSKHM